MLTPLGDVRLSDYYYHHHHHHRRRCRCCRHHHHPCYHLYAGYLQLYIWNKPCLQGI